jgi:transcriptional regulator with XRE-family HTH domain
MAERLNVSARTYASYERGEVQIGCDALGYYAAMGWNVNWLITGDGPEKIEQLYVGEEKASYGSSPIPAEAWIKAVEAVDTELAIKQKRLAPSKRARVYMAVAELLQDEDELPSAKVIQMAINAAA